MCNTLVSGDTTELRCQLAFTERNYDTYKPTRASSKVDLIAEINGRLIRIQCKTASYYQEKESIKIFSSHQNVNTKQRFKYTKDEIDYFYTHFQGYDFLIPVEDADSYMKVLRLTTPTNMQFDKSSAASDYLLDKVLESIITNTPIIKFSENYIVSEEAETGKVKEWNIIEFNKTFEERQRRNIKYAINSGNKAYNRFWKKKDFPELKLIA